MSETKRHAFANSHQLGPLPFDSLSPTMATTSSSLLFDDIFTISAIDKEGKKFDRGSATPM